MPTEKNLTGYPSIDKPWLKYYPQELFSPTKPTFNKILDRIKMVWQNPEETIINYYDTEIKVGEFFNRVNQVAKSLVAMGLKKGDAVVASLECVPEYIELLFACEKIGCCIKNIIEDVDSIIALINKDETVSLYIAPDYINSIDVYAELNENCKQKAQIFVGRETCEQIDKLKEKLCLRSAEMIRFEDENVPKDTDFKTYTKYVDFLEHIGNKSIRLPIEENGTNVWVLKSVKTYQTSPYYVVSYFRFIFADYFANETFYKI